MNIQQTEKKTFEPVPAGVYTATIVEATESADGQYIQMRLDVGNNNCVFDRLYSDNATRARFVCEAVGKAWDGTVAATDLEGRTVSVDVTIQEKGDKTFNKILTWKQAAGGSPAAPSAPAKSTISDDDIPF